MSTASRSPPAPAAGELRLSIGSSPQRAQRNPNMAASSSSSPDARSGVSPASASSAAWPSLRHLEMPAYSAGALRDNAAWKAEDRNVLSPSSNGKLRAAATVAEARWKAISSSGEPLSGPAITASGVAVDSVPVEQMQLLSLKLTDAQASNQRKDALIGTLEQQVADLTRALSLHATARQEWAASEVARENALHSAEEEGRRLAHELDVERGEHVQTKHLLKLTVERQEAKWRTVRAEVERSEAERAEAERTALQLRNELEQTRQAVAETQKQHRVFEAQVRALSQQNEELHEKRRAEKSDLAYLAKEHQNLQQQLQLQAQELEAAQKAANTQKSLADRLTAELEAQRAELSALRTAAIAAETQHGAHVNLLRQGEEQCGKLETRIASQEVLIRQLQATVSERESEEVALAATKKQLAGALADLESTKNQVKALQTQLASTVQALNQFEQQTVPALQRQVNSLELQEKKLRAEVEARGRAFKMHVEQMQQVVQKNPFNARLSASTAPASSSSAASLAVEDLAPAASSSFSSSSTNAADGESFSQLREQFNVQLLELTSRTRAAHSLLLDAERTTKHAQDDLADARRQSAQLQREMAEAAAESGERLRAVEQQYMEVSAQLLTAKNEVQESQTISDAHHAHLRTVWESCQLLHRAFRPLLTRFRDVVQQKNFLSRELFAYHSGVAREVHELRVAMTVREGGDGDAAAATTAAAPLHPYRVHAPRLSLRSVAIAVLAARRIWTGSTVAGQQYGVMLHTGTADPVPLLASPPFELTNSLSRQSNDEAKARRERELALPSVDTTTLPAAASSLVKLLSHFDCSAALATAARPQLSSPSPHGHSLLQQLAASSAAFHSSRSSRVSRPARSSGPREDVVKIREVVLFLSSCIKELELQVLTGQQDYVSLIAASTATEEKLQAEQKRAHQMMREAVEEARDNELAATLRMKETELRLGACEAQKADMIDKEEYVRLQEDNLRKCSQLEQLNNQLQAQRTTLQQQVHQAGVDLRERDSIIQSLKKLAEEKQQALQSLENRTREQQHSASQLTATRNALLATQQQLSEARQLAQELESVCTQLTQERDQLLSSVDANARELERVRQVVRGVSDAQRLVSQHAQRFETPAPPATSRPAFTASDLFRHTAAASAALSSSPLRIPAASAGVLDSTVAAAGPNQGGGGATSINIRHHPSGNLSLDFGSGVTLQHAASGEAQTMTITEFPSAPQSAASAAPASQRHLLSYTPLPRAAPRVQFASDSKAYAD